QGLLCKSAGLLGGRASTENQSNAKDRHFSCHRAPHCTDELTSVRMKDVGHSSAPTPKATHQTQREPSSQSCRDCKLQKDLERRNLLVWGLRIRRAEVHAL